MTTAFDQNDPTYVWGPRTHQPKHAAGAVYDKIGLWRMHCPACGKIGEPGPHSYAMIDALNHRRKNR